MMISVNGIAYSTLGWVREILETHRLAPLPRAVLSLRSSRDMPVFVFRNLGCMLMISAR